MAQTSSLKLNNLNINTENYRFDPVASQKEAIDQMLVDQGDKLYNLAEHIMTNGLNPNDKIQVIASNHDSSKYNVLEGNRRTVAMKLLNNPDLIDIPDSASLKKKFRKLHETHKDSLLTELECTVYDSAEEADVWIKIKHAGQSEGVGTVAWTSQQVQRFEEKVEGKSSTALQTIKLLEASEEVAPEVKSKLNTLKITNLDRLISDPDIRSYLGVRIEGGIIQSEVDQKEVIRGLTKIVSDLLDPKFNVKRIYTKDDRKDYIKALSQEVKPDLNKKAAKAWQFTDFGNNSSSTSKGSAKPKPNPTDRKFLIPKSCILKINKPKINNIYFELQKLDVSKYTNAVAVLLRVFVELSVDSYLEEHSLTGESPSAAKSGIDFQQKVNKVANHLDTKNFADAAICKGMKNAIKDKNDILGIDTWHAYVHNNRFSPKDSHLIITWDNIQPFIESIWSNIK